MLGALFNSVSGAALLVSPLLTHGVGASPQSGLHVSLFPLLEEAAGDAVCPPLLPRNHAAAQHLQGGKPLPTAAE